ncbi:deazaflavin-dependent oxidoreductase (nitroreductase family) [Marmoricola sp. OAE513]|uniref:nitroreductase family deazaflavin-dependent oxidoreductase n=1 Tax=Marmoricola sp. OAE513 TaxID=2817894 RepID=UPI001AE4764D
MDKKPKGLDDPGTVKFMKVMAAANVWLFKRTGGRLGSHWRIGAGFRNPVPICLVEHTGRKTGLPRTTPLVYLRDGDRVVVVASQAGRPENPMWFLNVTADPEVVVQTGRDRVPMRAHVADADERAVLWPKLVDLYPDYDSYQSWTERVIPVVVLEPR